MSRNAQVIEYGGETVGNALYPPMGSGLWPTRGLGYAAFHRNVFFIDTVDQQQPATLTTLEPSPACYKDAGPFFSNNPTWAIYFWLGGPGGRGC
jgi:Neprosin